MFLRRQPDYASQPPPYISPRIADYYAASRRAARRRRQPAFLPPLSALSVRRDCAGFPAFRLH